MRTSVRVPYAQPVVTGGNLARDAADDFMGFFLPGREVPVRVQVAEVPIAITKGVGERARIVISPGMAQEIVDTPERLYFHLFILGHEIAHVVHLHNEVPDQPRNEHYALEMWRTSTARR